MKNPAQHIKSSMYALLSGVMYNGAEVPVYEGEGEVEPVQILINDSIGINSNSLNSFRTTRTERIEIIEEGSVRTKKHIDAINSTVINRFAPTPGSEADLSSVDFQIANVTVQPPTYLHENSGQQTWINRLTQEIQFTIIEK